MNWRERIAMGAAEAQDMSAESMAASRIMKGLDACVKDIGRLCRSYGIEYDEDETTFDRAVHIFRETYSDAKALDFVDARTVSGEKEAVDSLLEDQRSGILFCRVKGKQGMTAYIKGNGLMFSPLGQLVIRPGIRYIADKDGVELWEQDPVRLVKSFSRRQQGESTCQ